MDGLPIALYTSEQSRRLDRLAQSRFEIDGIELMERAGREAFACLRRHWPEAGRIVVVAGPGNNGGDGFVVARLAREAGLPVRVLCPGGPPERGEAAIALERFVAANGRHEPFSEARLDGADLVVDALFGSGLSRPLDGRWRLAAEACARQPAPVLALDCPSGISADTGAMLGRAIPAERTISFIALKRGLLTGEGPEYCGCIEHTVLDLPASLFEGEPVAAERFPFGRVRDRLSPRHRSAHKGDFGHVLVVGGAPGMLGAARLAAEAALRSGAGLVSVATHPMHAAILDGLVPEAMTHGVRDGADLAALIARATVVAVGPGLGRDGWGDALFAAALDHDRPKVVDADALNRLADGPFGRDDWVLTPHPGEAARLVGTSPRSVQADRFAAVRDVQGRYGGVCLLKGAGTLVFDGYGPVGVVTGGNPGMATGGIGDVLTGIVAGLLAQGLDAREAACVGAAVHARAGDLAAADGGERGLVASDVVARIRAVVDSR